MEVKSFNEVKKILGKFPKFSGVGYVVAPQLMKIAIQLGLMGYEEALLRWKEKHVFGEKVLIDYSQHDYNEAAFFIEWEGASVRKVGNTIIIGLRQTMAMIDICLGSMEEKKDALQK